MNRLTSSYTDAVTYTPAHKEASVNMRVLPEAIVENPLPCTNFRFGHPTPQRGVEVEGKWQRPDYTPPGNPPTRISCMQLLTWDTNWHPLCGRSVRWPVRTTPSRHESAVAFLRTSDGTQQGTEGEEYLNEVGTPNYEEARSICQITSSRAQSNLDQ